MKKITRFISTALFATVSLSGASSALARDEKEPPVQPSEYGVDFCSDWVQDIVKTGNRYARWQIDQLIARDDQSNVQSILQKRYNFKAADAKPFAECISRAHFMRNKVRNKNQGNSPPAYESSDDNNNNGGGGNSNTPNNSNFNNPNSNNQNSNNQNSNNGNSNNNNGSNGRRNTPNN